MWTAVSGASSQFEKMSEIANNLANVETDGFKKDTLTFREYLTALEKVPDVKEVPRGPIREAEFYPLDGRDQSYVILDGTHTSFHPGSLKVTHHPFDLALEGPGFFEVETPQGIRLTRSGRFQMDAQGFLVNTEGHFVLRSDPSPGNEGEAGKPEHSLDLPASVRRIRLSDLGNLPLGVSQSGDLFVGDDRVARVSVVEFERLEPIRKQGGTLFKNWDPNLKPHLGKQTRVLQGVLERSNVNPIEEMSRMIQTNRLFEQNLKMLKTYGEVLGREANDLGKI